MKWHKHCSAPAFHEQASRVMSSRIFGESVIIKRWLTWEDVSLIFFLSGPVQFKDITTNLIACSESCCKWWRNCFTSEAVSLLLTAFQVSSGYHLALTGSISVFFDKRLSNRLGKNALVVQSREKQFSNDVLKDNGNNFDQPCKLASKWTRTESNKTILRTFGSRIADCRGSLL